MYTHTNLPIEKRPKLVRDLIPEIIEKNDNIKPKIKILNDEEFGIKRIEKLHEETEELALAIKDKTNPVQELADILELIYATGEYVGSTPSEIEKERQKKFEKRGGFSKRIMLLSQYNNPRHALSHNLMYYGKL